MQDASQTATRMIELGGRVTALQKVVTPIEQLLSQTPLVSFFLEELYNTDRHLSVVFREIEGWEWFQKCWFEGSMHTFHIQSISDEGEELSKYAICDILSTISIDFLFIFFFLIFCQTITRKNY